jgi:DNA-binding transcriptional regulator YiaG
MDGLLEENRALRQRIAELESSTNNRPKLSEQDVKDIRAAYRNGMSQSELADSYGVNPATVSRTVRGLYH